ncbi:hypothetical protein SO694_00100027 [Aureococcus anophagefferens]|uniref:DZANK-type domain-containing protein n=2 Tax=Aureococcus anophagefferens TaxID=44056 RepID=A0ABR1FMZ7_AURAN
MLASQRDVGERQRDQMLASLAEKEMAYILSDLANIGTQAALIAGFVYSSVADPDADEGGPPNSHVVEGLLLVTINTAAVVTNLVVVTTSTFVATSGPYEALTGDEATLWRTLRVLQRERSRVMTWYWLGLFSFFLSLATTVYFSRRNNYSRGAMIGVSLLGLFVIRRNQLRIARDLAGAPADAPGSCLGAWAAALSPPARARAEGDDADTTLVVVSGFTSECPRCASPLDGASTCGRCGSRVVVQCRVCKSEMAPDATLCLRCGRPTRRDYNALAVEEDAAPAPASAGADAAVDARGSRRRLGPARAPGRRRARPRGRGRRRGAARADPGHGRDLRARRRPRVRVAAAGDGVVDVRCPSAEDAAAWSAAIHVAAVAIGHGRKPRRSFLSGRSFA